MNFNNIDINTIEQSNNLITILVGLILTFSLIAYLYIMYEAHQETVKAQQEEDKFSEELKAIFRHAHKSNKK